MMALVNMLTNLLLAYLLEDASKTELFVLNSCCSTSNSPAASLITAVKEHKTSWQNRLKLSAAGVAAQLCRAYTFFCQLQCVDGLCDVGTCFDTIVGCQGHQNLAHK